MNKLSEWWDCLDFKPKFLIIAISVFVIIMGIGTALEIDRCGDLVKLYGESREIVYTWPDGCKVLTDNGYWIDVDDAFLITK